MECFCGKEISLRTPFWWQLVGLLLIDKNKVKDLLDPNINSWNMESVRQLNLENIA